MLQRRRMLTFVNEFMRPANDLPLVLSSDVTMTDFRDRAFPIKGASRAVVLGGGLSDQPELQGGDDGEAQTGILVEGAGE